MERFNKSFEGCIASMKDEDGLEWESVGDCESCGVPVLEGSPFRHYSDGKGTDKEFVTIIARLPTRRARVGKGVAPGL